MTTKSTVLFLWCAFKASKLLHYNCTTVDLVVISITAPSIFTMKKHSACVKKHSISFQQIENENVSIKVIYTERLIGHLKNK